MALLDQDDTYRAIAQRRRVDHDIAAIDDKIAALGPAPDGPVIVGEALERCTQAAAGVLAGGGVPAIVSPHLGIEHVVGALVGGVGVVIVGELLRRRTSALGKSGIATPPESAFGADLGLAMLAALAVGALATVIAVDQGVDASRRILWAVAFASAALTSVALLAASVRHRAHADRWHTHEGQAAKRSALLERRGKLVEARQTLAQVVLQGWPKLPFNGKAAKAPEVSNDAVDTTDADS